MLQGSDICVRWISQLLQAASMPQHSQQRLHLNQTTLCYFAPNSVLELLLELASYWISNVIQLTASVPISYLFQHNGVAFSPI